MFWVRFRSAVILVIITLAAMILGNNLLFAILFSRNFENSVKQNEMYEEINEYHQFYKEPQKL